MSVLIDNSITIYEALEHIKDGKYVMPAFQRQCSDDAAQHTQHTIDDMCLGKCYRLSLRHMKSYQ